MNLCVNHGGTGFGFGTDCKICDQAGYPDDNPKTVHGMAKIPLHLVPPSALYALALAFKHGADKYGPFNWREKAISATTYYAACLRHLTSWYDGDDLDPDSGEPHLYHALACIAMLIDGKTIGKLNDNRPPKGAVSAMNAAYAGRSAPEDDDPIPQVGDHVMYREGMLWSKPERLIRRVEERDYGYDAVAAHGSRAGSAPTLEELHKSYRVVSKSEPLN